MITIFWISLAVIAYTYIGYPIVLILLSRIRNRSVKKVNIMPKVSIIISAYNEEKSIEKKIQNCLVLDYDLDKLEIIVGSDGSTDSTVAIAKKFANSRVKVFEYQPNRGKICVINDIIQFVLGDIIVFSDASCNLAHDALKHLVSNFADPGVGCVSGVYKVLKKDEAILGRSEDFYWNYETFIKVKEAEIGTVLGAHGSFYAIRKKLYPFPEPHTINDDYVIPVRISQMGYRTAYEPKAVAYEEAEEMGGFSRRVRIMAGNYQQMREIKGFIRPLRLLTLFGFLSHKFGRVIVPFFLVTLFISNVFLLDNPYYLTFWYMQIGFYGLAVLGKVIRRFNIKLKLLQLPFYFCMINLASFLGLYYAYFSRTKVSWKRSQYNENTGSKNC